MCGRYTLAGKPVDLEKYFRAKLLHPERFEQRYNVAPTQAMPIISGDAPELMDWNKWGIKRPYFPSLQINTRLETWQKRAIPHTVPCLIPASGYYEWRKSGKSRQPFYIYSRNSAWMGFAGLLSSEGTFSILTKPATDTLQPLHHRMPVVLSNDQADVWLQGLLKAEQLLHAPSEKMDWVWHAVSVQVNQVHLDKAQLMAPAPFQGNLFDEF